MALNPPRLNPIVAEVTARIVERSRETRADYSRRMDAARDAGAGPGQAVLRQLGPRLRRPDRWPTS